MTSMGTNETICVNHRTYFDTKINLRADIEDTYK